MTDFERLYERHARDVYRFALYLSGDRAIAEDVTSETFVRVWTAPARVELATVRAYLLTIARNLYLQGLRRQRRRTEMPEEVPDPAPGPHDEAADREEMEAVMAALLMRAEDGLSYAEIAAALGVSKAAAKVKVHRARLKLAFLRGI